MRVSLHRARGVAKDERNCSFGWKDCTHLAQPVRLTRIYGMVVRLLACKAVRLPPIRESMILDFRRLERRNNSTSMWTGVGALCFAPWKNGLRR